MKKIMLLGMLAVLSHVSLKVAFDFGELCSFVI